MSQISKVDKILQEIYLDMELEEIAEFLDSDFSSISEVEGHAGELGRLSVAGKDKLAQIANARKLGNSELAKKLTKQLLAIKTKMRGLKAGAGKVASKALASDTGQKVAAAAGQAKELVTQNPASAAAAAAAAVAAIAAAVVIYKKFFSQAARACKGKSGPDKKNCVTSFKVKGLQAAKAKLSAGMSKCKNDKCKAKLKAKMQSFDAKINAMKGKVSESVIDGYVGDFMSEVFEQDSKN